MTLGMASLDRTDELGAWLTAPVSRAATAPKAMLHWMFSRTFFYSIGFASLKFQLSTRTCSIAGFCPTKGGGSTGVGQTARFLGRRSQFRHYLRRC
jgi:hypothetical protein